MDSYIEGLLINDTNRDNKEQIIYDFKKIIKKLISGTDQCHVVICGPGNSGKSTFSTKLMRALGNKALKFPFFMDINNERYRRLNCPEVQRILSHPDCLVIISEPNFIPRTDIDRILYVTNTINKDKQIYILDKPIVDVELININFVNKFNNPWFLQQLNKLISNKQFLDYFIEEDFIIIN